MKQPTLAFLIPSRDHFDRLLRMVGSLRSHPDSAEFEINVYFDSDDHASLDRSKELWKHNAIVHIGPRLNGYGSLGEFCSRMADVSKCPWVCVANDDNILKGGSFISELKEQPTTGVYCTAEVYQLNTSHYTDFYQFAFIPNGSWKIESPIIPEPADLWLYETLVVKHGWKIRRLPGVIMAHEWTQR